MRTISYSEARQNLSATMMKAVEDHAPILITRQNGEACVLMSLEYINFYVKEHDETYSSQ